MVATKDIIQLSIADIIISIKFKDEHEFPRLAKIFKKKINRQLKSFIVKDFKKPHFTITVIYKNTFDTLVDVKSKKHLIGFYEEVSGKQFITYYHISAEQFLIIVRDIIQNLISNQKGIIIHGSASVLGDKAIIFLGKSGAGKSTIVSLIKNPYQSFADDIFIIRKINGSYYIYQTPFVQKNVYSKISHGRFLLTQIFFIKKGLTETKQVLTKNEKIFTLLSQQLFMGSLNEKKQVEFLLELSCKKNFFSILTFSKSNKQKLLDTIQ